MNRPSESIINKDNKYKNDDKYCLEMPLSTNKEQNKHNDIQQQYSMFSVQKYVAKL